MLKANLFIVSDDYWEESEPANSRDSRSNIFLDTMLSEMQCIVSWILTAVYVSFLCQERAGVYSLALCLFSFYSRRHACLKPIAGNAAIGRFQCHVQMLSSVV